MAKFNFHSVVCARLAMQIVASRTGKAPGRTTFQDWHRAERVQKFSIGGSRDLFFWRNEIEEFAKGLADRNWPRVRNSIQNHTARRGFDRSEVKGGEA